MLGNLLGGLQAWWCIGWGGWRESVCECVRNLLIRCIITPGCYQIGEAWAESLAGVLGQCPALAHLHIHGNGIEAVGKGRLQASWRGQASGLILYAPCTACSLTSVLQTGNKKQRHFIHMHRCSLRPCTFAFTQKSNEWKAWSLFDCIALGRRLTV